MLTQSNRQFARGAVPCSRGNAAVAELADALLIRTLAVCIVATSPSTLGVFGEYGLRGHDPCPA